MNNLAPIVLFVYNRPWHTEQTLLALKSNKLAESSKLYIYCDGVKADATTDQKNTINQVRNIVKSQQWCGEVQIIESAENRGLANSIKNGVTEIIEKYGRVIVMEDDLLTSNSFLIYMNSALDYYEKRNSVFSITGYNVPEQKMDIPIDYPYDVYASSRNGSWGWATWLDRWHQVDWNVKSYATMINNPYMQKAFNRGGDDMFEMLTDQQSGKLNIWSIQFTVAHFVNHAVAIVPTKSYVDNIGLDGSGDNSGVNYGLRNSNLSTIEDIRFLDILYEDERLINAFYNVNCRQKRPLWQKIINRLFRIIGLKSPYVIKKKIYC